MADPAFVSMFSTNSVLRDNYYLDGIVTLVDAKNGLTRLNEIMPKGEDGLVVLNEAVEQLTHADRVIINKIDLVNEKELHELEKKNCSIE